VKPGSVRIEKPDGSEEFVFIAGGILEVQPNRVTVLSDTAIRGQDLDEEKAKAARAAAEEALKNAKSEIDLARAQSELAVMAAQLPPCANTARKNSRLSKAAACARHCQAPHGAAPRHQGAFHGIHAADPRRHLRGRGAARVRPRPDAGRLPRLHRGAATGGVVRFEQPPAPASSATAVRVRDGKTEVLNGPFIETKEELGGYYLIDVPNIDSALSWAARCPGANFGTIEVRPVWADERVLRQRGSAPPPRRPPRTRRARSYGKLVAFLSARTRDVAAAEDALSEAFAAALAEWPGRGIPTVPRPGC
jgi:hypothetical protein